MAAHRPYLQKVEEDSMAARKVGQSEDSGVSQVLKKLSDAISKAMGHSAELSSVVNANFSAQDRVLFRHLRPSF
jgi:hypothetical protein